MSLYSGKRLHRYILGEIPIDQDTIDRVEQLAREGKNQFQTTANPCLNGFQEKRLRIINTIQSYNKKKNHSKMKLNNSKMKLNNN